jgi:antiviral helicase SKI2
MANIQTQQTYQTEEIVALLSCLIYEEKEKVEPALTENLNSARTTLVKIATNLAEIQISCGLFLLCSMLFIYLFILHWTGLQINVTEYLESCINFTLMEVVYEWANATVSFFSPKNIITKQKKKKKKMPQKNKNQKN